MRVHRDPDKFTHRDFDADRHADSDGHLDPYYNGHPDPPVDGDVYADVESDFFRYADFNANRYGELDEHPFGESHIDRFRDHQPHGDFNWDPDRFRHFDAELDRIPDAKPEPFASGYGFAHQYSDGFLELNFYAFRYRDSNDDRDGQRDSIRRDEYADINAEPNFHADAHTHVDLDRVDADSHFDGSLCIAGFVSKPDPGSIAGSSMGLLRDVV